VDLVQRMYISSGWFRVAGRNSRGLPGLRPHLVDAFKNWPRPISGTVPRPPPPPRVGPAAISLHRRADVLQGLAVGPVARCPSRAPGSLRHWAEEARAPAAPSSSFPLSSPPCLAGETRNA